MMVSVIIPVYNVECYISKCLDSIKAQTFQDYEIVIVNDASKDKSMDVVQKYALKDNRIKIFNHPRNLGLMETRRTGYRNASGDYFVFLDSDDYLASNALELLYNAISIENADVVCADCIYVYDDGTPKGKYSSKLRYGSDSKSVYKSLLSYEMSHSICCGKIYRKDLFRNHEYQTYEHFTYGEDTMLFYQIVKNAHKIIKLDASLYYYVQRGNSSVHIRLPESSLNSIVLMEKMRYKCTNYDRELERMASAFITKELTDFYYRGYGKSLDYLLEKHQMKRFVEWNEVKSQRYLPINQLISCFVKKHSPWFNKVVRFVVDSNLFFSIRVFVYRILNKKLKFRK